jgi:hypothetical protein
VAACLAGAPGPRADAALQAAMARLEDEFRGCAEFILPDDRGLTLPGLLRTYDDGGGDVDRDFLALSLLGAGGALPSVSSRDREQDQRRRADPRT